MEILITIILLIVLVKLLTNNQKKRHDNQKPLLKYNYKVKKSVMTTAEENFYKKLTSA